MTTIATDGRTMAGDGLATDHFDTIVNVARVKVHRIPDGRIVGCTGNSFDAQSYREWLADGENGDCPVKQEQFSALILNTDGSVEFVDHKGRRIATPAPAATGSGQDYAFGAMDHGASPGQAVLIACGRDIHSGGVITEIERTIYNLEAA